jgi:hypothetical protein
MMPIVSSIILQVLKKSRAETVNDFADQVLDLLIPEEENMTPSHFY